jgi:hypothetical protein
MDSSVRDLLYRFGQKIAEYAPNLLGGLLLIAAGWGVAWLAKRVVVQLCAVFHLDRLLRRFRWGEGFAKADVRGSLFDWIGSAVALIVFLIFLDGALGVMRLAFLSDLLQRGVWFIPKIIIAVLIIGLGWMIGAWVRVSVEIALRREGIPRAGLMGRFARAMVIVVFSAMALTEIGIARQIVVIGFTAVIVTICLLAILGVWLARKELLKREEKPPGEP